MAYIVKARFYAGMDQMGESYIIVSDNSEKDTKIEVGAKVYIEQNDQGHSQEYGTTREG